LGQFLTTLLCLFSAGYYLVTNKSVCVVACRIFELQSRSIVGLLDVCLFGLGIVAFGLYYALVWLSPATLVFTYLIPILPLVLVFDGWVSVLRTRTPDEVEALLRTCGADGGDEELARWEVRSGKERFLGKNGYVHWIVCVKREEMDEL